MQDCVCLYISVIIWVWGEYERIWIRLPMDYPVLSTRSGEGIDIIELKPGSGGGQVERQN